MFSCIRFFFSLFICAACYTTASQSKNLSEFQHVWTNFLLQRGIDHHQMDPGSLLEYEFGLLEEFSLRQIIRSRPFDPLMDRYDDGCPYHENKITLLDGTEMSASVVRLHEDVFNYDTFIATQAPFQHNVHSFWKMIEENDIDQVVMLTELFEDPSFELCHAYWPENKDEKLILKNGTQITLSDEYEILSELSEYIQIRKLHLRTPAVEREITHYWYRQWKNDFPPFHTQTLLTLLNLVETKKNEKQSFGPLLVHCSGGMGRAGVFMTLYHLMQRVRNGDNVSLFHLAASLRWQRPYAICVLNQYQFCHEIHGQFIKE